MEEQKFTTLQELTEQTKDLPFEEISELFEKTFLERAYLLDGWIFLFNNRRSK